MHAGPPKNNAIRVVTRSIVYLNHRILQPIHSSTRGHISPVGYYLGWHSSTSIKMLEATIRSNTVSSEIIKIK